MNSTQRTEVLRASVGLSEGQNVSIICPVCGGGRTHERSFSVGIREGIVRFLCFRSTCGARGSLSDAPAVRISSNSSSLDRKPANFLPFELEDLPNDKQCSLFERYPAFGSPDTFKQFARWCPANQRIAWSITAPSGALRGWELRSDSNKDRPKVIPYHHRTADPWVGHRRGSGGLGTRGLGGRRVVVLVEDIISASRVSLYGIDAVSLMGTNLDFFKLQDVVQAYPSCDLVMALDRDAALKSRSLVTTYSLWAEFQPLYLQKDLKYSTDEELGEFLNVGK